MCKELLYWCNKHFCWANKLFRWYMKILIEPMRKFIGLVNMFIGPIKVFCTNVIKKPFFLDLGEYWSVLLVSILKEIDRKLYFLFERLRSFLDHRLFLFLFDFFIFTVEKFNAKKPISELENILKLTQKQYWNVLIENIYCSFSNVSYRIISYIEMLCFNWLQKVWKFIFFVIGSSFLIFVNFLGRPFFVVRYFRSLQKYCNSFLSSQIFQIFTKILK